MGKHLNEKEIHQSRLYIKNMGGFYESQLKVLHLCKTTFERYTFLLTELESTIKAIIFLENKYNLSFNNLT